jgi:predicted PurR-regulated permease PerM
MSDKAPEELNPDAVLPSKAPEVTPGPSAAATLQAAPGAVRRSMPMALSICLGILLASTFGWLFYNLTWFVLILYLSFIAATILDAPVQWMKNHGIRRGFAAVIIMVGGLGIASAVGYFVATGIYTQMAAVSTNFQQAPKRINDFVNGFKHKIEGKKNRPAAAPASAPATADSQPASAPASQPGPAPGDIDVTAKVTAFLGDMRSLTNNALRGVEVITWLVIMFFIVLYMLVDGADHLKALRTLLPKHIRLEATKLFHEVSRAHRGWALASVLNIVSSTILTSTGLWFLGVPGAVILGFFAGLGELIPNIGPIAGAMPAVLLTLVAEPDKFIYVVGMFVVVQTIQSYTISPMMLKFSIEMPVLVTIVSVLVFGILFGFLGILVAIPVVADSVVVWNYVAKWREKDTLDYDIINAPPADTAREPAAPDNINPSRLRKLFRREKQRAALAQPPQDSVPSPPAAQPPATETTGLDRLEKAEANSTPKV